MIEVVMGVDPSLSATGLCTFNIYERFVVFECIKFDESFGKDFASVFKRILTIKSNLEEFSKLYPSDAVIMESPLPVGQMVGATSPLAFSLLDGFLNKYGYAYCMHPSYLKYLLKKARYKMREIVNLAKEIIAEEQFQCSLTRFSADEAVAFLLAYRLAIIAGYNPSRTRRRFLVEKESLIKEEEKICHGNQLQRLTKELKVLKT